MSLISNDELSVVKVVQQDALERLNLREMLLQPEMLHANEIDWHRTIRANLKHYQP